MLPPIQGKHRLGGEKQKYYEAAHAFLKHRRWRRTYEDEVSGITWMELLAMSDTLHYRTSLDRIVMSVEAGERAPARSKRRAKQRRTICTRASLA